MRKILCLGLMVICFTAAKAQSSSSTGYSYKTSLGVKVWDGAGVSLKMFTNNKPSNAAEFIAYFYRDGMRLTGLYEIHNDIAGAPGLRWYVGPGAHLGFYNSYHGNAGTFVGIDGVLG